MRWYAPLLVLVLIVAGVASCDSTKPANLLTEGETVALLLEIGRLIDDGFGDSGTEDCSAGGEATVTSTYDRGANGDSIWVRASATIVPTDCEAAVGGDTLTLNGKPNVQYTADAWFIGDDIDPERGKVRTVFGGAMTWLRRNGDTDTCSIDLTFESTEFDDNGDPKGDFRGSMCSLDLVIDPNKVF